MASPTLYAVIMAGGSGTRFWPASRAARPKQYLPISGVRPMIAETIQRLEGLVPLERTLVVTAAGQEEMVCECVPELPPDNLIVEPEARNTAACVALAVSVVAQRAPDAIQAVLPADHVIEPAESFRATLLAAAREAEDSGALLTFGIRPTFPATGYGYVEAGDVLHERDGHAVHSVTRFVEKPDLERAEEFLASGRFLWNSGMFVWSTAAIRAAYERHLPEAHAGIERLLAGDALAAVYPDMPALPVDVGILERADNVRMLPIEYRWSDVGSWAALPDVHATDEDGNWPVLADGARLLAEDAEGCVAYAEGDEVVALIGVRDLVVVRAGNATLVCPRERAQDVKAIVERLRRDGAKYL
jgi:mannose-1-phosphate guanylyltransferase